MSKGIDTFLKARMLDCADDGNFRFALRCGACRKQWDAQSVAISSKAISEGFTGETYQSERIWAMEEAVAQADEQFDLCPICGAVVCLDCIKVTHELAMCTLCQAKLAKRMKLS